MSEGTVTTASEAPAPQAPPAQSNESNDKPHAPQFPAGSPRKKDFSSPEGRKDRMAKLNAIRGGEAPKGESEGAPATVPATPNAPAQEATQSTPVAPVSDPKEQGGQDAPKPQAGESPSQAAPETTTSAIDGTLRTKVNGKERTYNLADESQRAHVERMLSQVGGISEAIESIGRERSAIQQAKSELERSAADVNANIERLERLRYSPQQQQAVDPLEAYLSNLNAPEQQAAPMDLTKDPAYAALMSRLDKQQQVIDSFQNRYKDQATTQAHSELNAAVSGTILDNAHMKSAVLRIATRAKSNGIHMTLSEAAEIVHSDITGAPLTRSAGPAHVVERPPSATPPAPPRVVTQASVSGPKPAAEEPIKDLKKDRESVVGKLAAIRARRGQRR